MSTPEEIEGRVRAALGELGIAGWKWIEIDPQYGDTADFCEQYGYDLPHSANTIVVASKRGPAAVLRGDREGVRAPGCEQASARVDGECRGRRLHRRKRPERRRE